MKYLDFNIALKSTNPQKQTTRPKVFTNDLDSVMIRVTVTDMTDTDLLGSSAEMLLYMQDRSFFQNSDVTRDGNVFKYLLKENEGNHAGIARLQLPVKTADGKTYAQQKLEFEIESGLETKVATEVMIHDWTTLTREARAYIDAFTAAEVGRQAEFEDAQTDRTNQFNAVKSNFEGVVSTAKSQVEANILETAVEEKFNNLEAEYAEDLTLTKTQLAEKTLQITRIDANKADKTQVNSVVTSKANTTDLIQTNANLSATNTRIDNLVIPLSPENSNIQVTDALVSTTKSKTFTTIRNRLEESEEDLKKVGVKHIAFTKGYNITTGNIGDIINLTPNVVDFNSYAIVECKQGDKFILNVIGGNNARAWCFADSNNKILSVSPANVAITNSEIIAPANTVKCIINSDNGGLGDCIHKSTIFGIDDEALNLRNIVSNVESSLYDRVYKYSIGYISTSGNIETSNTSIYSEFIEINGKGYIYTKPGYSFVVALYDESKKFISRNEWANNYFITTNGYIRVCLRENGGGIAHTDTSISSNVFIYTESNIDNNEKYTVEVLEQVSSVIDLLGIDMFKNKTVTIAKDYKYSAWPMIGVINDRLVCFYTVADQHDSTQSNIVLKTSKNGVVWSMERPITFETQNDVISITGVGNDNDGNLLLWVRDGSPALQATTHKLYKYDGNSIVKVSEPSFSLRGGHIGDVFSVPDVGLFSFYNSYINGNISRSWGILKSLDNGLTWSQIPIEENISKAECPVEIDGVYIGDGKILAMGRKDDYTGTMAMFQIQSSDYGSTWTKEYTNITDIDASSPSIIFNSNNNELSLYYYDRGTGNSRLRRKEYTDIWSNPSNWSASEVKGTGTIGQDAGNVKAVEFNGNQVSVFYSGSAIATGIYGTII